MIFNLVIVLEGGESHQSLENMPLPRLYRLNKYAHRRNKEIEAAQNKANARATRGY